MLLVRERPFNLKGGYGFQTDLIIMDFAKAFDKVSHKHLMYKISYYGINCNAFHWVKDFLTDRTQTVTLEGETSNKIPVTSGARRILFRFLVCILCSVIYVFSH
jgi:hypothetical protein